MTYCASAIMRELMAAGVTGDALVTAFERIEASGKPARSNGAERQARYRERKAERNAVTSDATSSQSDAEVPSPLVPPLSPAPLSPPIIPPTSEKPTRRGTRVPDGFEPDATAERLAETLGIYHAEVRNELSKFLDYWRSVPGAKGLKLDWQGTFRNWLRNYNERRPRTFDNGTRNSQKPNSIAANLAAVDAVIDEIERREQASGQGYRGRDFAELP